MEIYLGNQTISLYGIYLNIIQPYWKKMKDNT